MNMRETRVLPLWSSFYIDDVWYPCHAIKFSRKTIRCLWCKYPSLLFGSTTFQHSVNFPIENHGAKHPPVEKNLKILLFILFPSGFTERFYIHFTVAPVNMVKEWHCFSVWLLHIIQYSRLKCSISCRCELDITFRYII